MDRGVILLFVYLSFPFIGYTQSNSCSSPITLSLDGVLRTYATSSATGNNVLCTANGTTPVTWFMFTTNAQAQCPLLNITVSDSTACEVGFYTSCGSLLTSSSMCFYDGYGLWAPNQNFIITANTTYYLRVKTSTACIIKIAGQHFAPPNDDCIGALPLDTTEILDNNACDHPGPGVSPSQLCATTLENTAWYKFIVKDSGYSVITILNIHCANGAANNNTGFQMGFFTGNCSNLQWLNCATGSGSVVQATTTILPAGTRVFLAIDGISGSNCSYAIYGLNIRRLLAAGLRNFSGWKALQSNLMQWSARPEHGAYYIIERSINGTDYKQIGRVESKITGSGTVTYSFADNHPLITAFYRLRQSDVAGNSTFSNVVYIDRIEMQDLDLTLQNPVFNSMNVIVFAGNSDQYNYSIINMQGQKIISDSKIFNVGINRFSVDISSMQAGQYCLILGNDKQRINKMFVKIR